MLRCQFLCHILKALFFIKIALKLSYFCKKMQNFWVLGGGLPPDPQPPAAGGFAPRPPRQRPPQLRISGYAPALYTFEKESDLALPFLDVLIEKSTYKFMTSIYRKPTFTIQYLRWNSFSPQKLKTNLILTLTHRALAICSPKKLPSELSKVKFIFTAYPEHVTK